MRYQCKTPLDLSARISAEEGDKDRVEENEGV
jgi:hypothetical protein